MKKNRSGPLKYGTVIDSDRNSFRAARKFLAECAEKNNISTHKFVLLELMVTEHLENIFRHGYKGKKGPVELVLTIKNRKIEVRIKDSCPAFNMLNKKIPDTAKRIKKGLGGRMGIKIIRELSDRLTYKRTKRNNINTFIVKTS